MDEHTTFKHVALTYADRKKAKIFFTDILGIPLTRTFTVSEKLADTFFGLEEEVDVDVYDNGEIVFEVFITKRSKQMSFEHTCMEINNKQAFIERCRHYDIEPILVDKNGKISVFVRDFSDNLFEIKER